MIPKIIHYCWLSGAPMPDLILQCIDSWKKHLGEYELILWDTTRFDVDSHPWVSETFQHKKYAFASDYIRLYALYHYGGIYLDTDVEVLQPFDELLDLPYFIGEEKSKFGFEAASFGAEKGSDWIKMCLNKFDDREFHLGWGRFEQTVLPEIIRVVVEENYQLAPISSISEFSDEEGMFYRFPTDYFSPKDWFTKKMTVTGNTYSIHHFDNSWKKNLSMQETIRLRVSKMVDRSGLRKLMR